jgi:hypothetical protein
MHDDQDEGLREFGAAVLEEIVVRAGLDQPSVLDQAEIQLSLDVVVAADSNGVVIRCARVGQEALECSVTLGPGG